MDARSRLAVSIAAGVVAVIPAVILTPISIAVLLGWDVVAATFLLLAWLAIRGCDAAATKARATATDDSRAVAEVVLIAASLASLVGVGFALAHASGTAGLSRAGTASIAILSVVLSWACVHAIFALRYARLYYAGGGGIDYHDKRAPEYVDFIYVSLTVGMTFQVSDTDLTSRAIRHTALRQALLSYVFGVVIVAMMINIVASLLTK